MRCPLVAGLALLLAAPAAAQADRPWETADWSVTCSDPARLAVPAMCDDESPVAAAAFVRDQLGDASGWLRGLGFPGPAVYTDGRTAGRNRPGRAEYLAEIGGDAVQVGGEDVCGFYRNDAAGGGGALVVNAGHMIQLGGAADETGTAAHELFHAVEASYPFFAGRTRAHGWVVEGMAQAVEAAYLHRAHGVPVFGPGGHAYAYGPRDYSQPLTARDEGTLIYQTSHFWLALGDLLGSRDRVAYLHDVLQRVDAERGGIAGVDAALRAFHPRGLYHLYPQVIARYVRDIDHFAAPQETEPIAGRFERVRPVEVEPNAARYVRVVLAPPPGVVLGVRVTLTDATNAHLVVDDQVYSDARPDPDAPRNEFRTQVSEADTLALRLVHMNIAGSGTASSEFTLTIEVEPLDACAAGPMMATLHPDFERAQQQIRAVVPGGLMDRGLILDAATYQRQFEIAETAPAPGDLRLSGLVSDGGVGCGDPVGRAPMWAALALGQTAQLEAAFADPARQAEMLARIQARMGTMSEAEFDAHGDSTMALAAQVGSMWTPDEVAGLGFASEFVADEVAALTGPHTALKVFSPNAFGWQVDFLPGGHNAVQHGGAGGWQANAAAVVPVLLPGTDVQRLRPGQSVEARLAANPDDADDEAVIVYSRWTGRHAPLPDEPTHAFEGEVVTVRSRSLAGTFEVTEVTGAEVRGRLRLTGPAHRLTETYRYTRDGDGRIDGDEIARDAEARGPLTVEATLRLPAAAEVSRPGRFIEHTARLGAR